MMISFTSYFHFQRCSHSCNNSNNNNITKPKQAHCRTMYRHFSEAPIFSTYTLRETKINELACQSDGSRDVI